MLAHKTALVTGAGQGIGAAIARALAAQGMRVCVADIDPVSAQNIASEINGVALTCDVSDPEQVRKMVDDARNALGRIDMLVSNAGFARGEPDHAVSAPDEQWQLAWDVHVMAHVRAARLVLPEMIEQGEGWLINVASAAGLLNQIGDAAYSATKHAAVSLAQSLAITHGDDGINVSVVCPLYVATPLLGYGDDAAEARPHDRVLMPEDVAQALISGLHDGQFLILPHDEAGEMFRKRGDDPDRWVRGMRKLRRHVMRDGKPADLRALHRRV